MAFLNLSTIESYQSAYLKGLFCVVLILTGIQAVARNGDDSLNFSPRTQDPEVIRAIGSLVPSHSDEFSQDSLDTKKWINDLDDWGVSSWEPANAVVRDDMLKITMRYSSHIRDGKHLFYTSGAIRTRAEPILYGYFEARIRASERFPGVCPAFWLYNIEPRTHTEIDIVELTQDRELASRIFMNTHVFRIMDSEVGRIRGHRSWDADFDPRDDFHIYGCLWTSKEIVWYVDGAIITRCENSYWHQPLDVIFSFGLRYPLTEMPSAEGFPVNFVVDFIRTWKLKEPSRTGSIDDAEGRAAQSE